MNHSLISIYSGGSASKRGAAGINMPQTGLQRQLAATNASRTKPYPCMFASCGSQEDKRSHENPQAEEFCSHDGPVPSPSLQ